MAENYTSRVIKKIIKEAKKKNKHIVLPDAMDERTITAARKIVNENIARISLIGDEMQIQQLAEELNISLENISIVDPDKSENTDKFTTIFYELRKDKGVTPEEALKVVKRPLYYGALMVREGLADGSVAGSISTSGSVLRAAIQTIGLAEGITIASGFFLIIFPEKVYTFADCAVAPNPDANQLAEIAVLTAESHFKLTGETPRVAMLSFSTKGSASHLKVEKVQKATEIVRKKKPDLIVDGELQLDAAIVPSVAKQKAPDSPLNGNANVLIFPNLDAGNIGYKMAQRMAGAEAIGPLVQGLRKPAYDLSRGCNVDDIVCVTAINAVMG